VAETSSHVTVGVTATKLVDESQAVAGFKADLKNIGAATVFIGGSGVTTSNGYEIPAGGTYTWSPSEPGEALYGIVATGTVVVEVLTEVA
jgi:hypothetical protein